MILKKISLVDSLSEKNCWDNLTWRSMVPTILYVPCVDLLNNACYEANSNTSLEVAVDTGGSTKTWKYVLQPVSQGSISKSFLSQEIQAGLRSERLLKCRQGFSHSIVELVCRKIIELWCFFALIASLSSPTGSPLLILTEKVKAFAIVLPLI
jgi:hypothetical protein